MIKYDCNHFDPKRLPWNSIDRIQIELIPRNSRVLEIGCATGFMSEYMERELGCTVTGVEIDPSQVEIAKSRCNNIICGSIDSSDVSSKIEAIIAEKGHYDIVFASQVIEHIPNPGPVLMKFHKWLNQEGRLIVSTVNVAHWKNRIKLLFGRWEYTDYGLLDIGHVRFYTVHTFKKLVESYGYVIEKACYGCDDIRPFFCIPILRYITPTNILRAIPIIGKKLASRYIDFCANVIAIQFVLSARRKEK